MQANERLHADCLKASEQGQKMLKGEAYFGSDKHLSSLRMQTKQLCYEYNHCAPNDNKQRRMLLKQLLPNVKGLWLEPNFYCDYGINVFAKHQVFINHNVIFLDGAPITLGDNVLIGPNCLLAATTHPIDPELRRKGVSISKPISIGNNAWLGANVSVLAGVTIGENAVIGAGVVVRKDVNAGEILKENN